VIHPWPPRSPDLTVCGFFMGVCKRKNIYVPQLSKNLEELKIRIKDVINAVTSDMISNLSSMTPANIYAKYTTITVPNLSTR